MELKFSKMEGLGNDFVVFDDRDERIGKNYSYNELSVKLCDRHFGVVLNSSTHDIKYRIFNPDGSEPQMCGNGMRCFAKFVFENGIVAKEEFKVETLAGTIIPKVNVVNGKVETVRVDMGEPITTAAKVPFISKLETSVSEELNIDGTVMNVTAVSMGNPHAVFFVEKATDSLVKTMGPKIEIHERFPEKTNVEFIEVLSRNEMNMRVWERGAGETLACGTGACATLVAAVLNNKTDNKALIHLMGGDLTIEWNRESNHVFKTGPAKLVFNGVLEL